MPRSKVGVSAGKVCSIRQAGSGDWIARECRGGAERHFLDRRSAVRFALFGRGKRAGAALLIPTLAVETRHGR